MSPDADKKASRAWPVIHSFSNAVAQYPWLLAVVILGSIGLEVTAIIAPLYLRDFIDALATMTPGASIQPLIQILMFFGLFMILRWLAGGVQLFFVNHLEIKTMADLSNDAFKRLLGHSHEFFISNFAGSLTRRVNRYSRSFEQIFDSLVFNFFTTAIFAVGAIYVLFERHVLLGVGLLVWTLIFLTAQIFLSKWKHPLRIARAYADTQVTAVLSDAVTNQSTVSQFSASSHEISLYNDVIRKWQAATVRSWDSDWWINTIQGLLIVLVQVGLLMGAAYLWERGSVTVGDFVLIQVYVLGLIDRIWRVGSNLRSMFGAFADAYEMVEIFEKPFGVEDAPGASRLAVTEGKVSMRSIDFGFSEKGILKDFSLTIEPGEKVALVGPSGAGKSTVTKLLLRLYDVDSGVVEIDGQDIAKVTQDSLRQAIAFVPQEPILFHRSLMDNIRYGRRDATDEEVFEAAKKARCHDFTLGLPEGYDTFVGERGVKLSGGERQRVAIARAILKNAPILILDEATSSLDSESESLIQEALQVLMEGKTVIVIAHRLSTIMHMDRIVVMEQGKIAAEGTHDELLDHQGGLYHKLWSIQAGSFIADTKD